MSWKEEWKWKLGIGDLDMSIFKPEYTSSFLLNEFEIIKTAAMFLAMNLLVLPVLLVTYLIKRRYSKVGFLHDSLNNFFHFGAYIRLLTESYFFL